jgi:AcrR family transcriptional regulator
MHAMTSETKAHAGYHHGDLPNALLEAVGEIVEEKGAANVSLREAARRAGVSHSAPAHHFQDKDGMIAAYCHQGFAILGAQMAEAFEPLADASPEERIAVAGATYVRFADEHRAHFDVMFRSGLQSIDIASHDELAEQGAMNLLNGLVGELVESGILDESDAEVFTVSLWGLAHGIASLWVDGAISKMFPDMTLDGLLGRAFGDSRLAYEAVSRGI